MLDLAGIDTAALQRGIDAVQRSQLDADSKTVALAVMRVAARQLASAPPGLVFVLDEASGIARWKVGTANADTWHEPRSDTVEPARMVWALAAQRGAWLPVGHIASPTERHKGPAATRRSAAKRLKQAAVGIASASPSLGQLLLDGIETRTAEGGRVLARLTRDDPRRINTIDELGTDLEPRFAVRRSAHIVRTTSEGADQS